MHLLPNIKFCLMPKTSAKPSLFRSFSNSVYHHSQSPGDQPCHSTLHSLPMDLIIITVMVSFKFHRTMQLIKVLCYGHNINQGSARHTIITVFSGSVEDKGYPYLRNLVTSHTNEVFDLFFERYFIIPIHSFTCAPSSFVSLRL